jgi:replicative superfamily II helicase
MVLQQKVDKHNMVVQRALDQKVEIHQSRLLQQQMEEVVVEPMTAIHQIHLLVRVEEVVVTTLRVLLEHQVKELQVDLVLFQAVEVEVEQVEQGQMQILEMAEMVALVWGVLISRSTILAQ